MVTSKDIKRLDQRCDSLKSYVENLHTCVNHKADGMTVGELYTDVRELKEQLSALLGGLGLVIVKSDKYKVEKTANAKLIGTLDGQRNDP